MLSSHILYNICRKIISSYTYRLIRYNTRKCNYSNLSSTPSYINNHISHRLCHIYTYTNSCCHWLRDHIYFFTSTTLCTFFYCTFFNLCYTTRYAYDHTQLWCTKCPFGIYHFNKTTYHLLGRLKICNYTIF